ncbi:hypothetical protein P2G88_18505 [Aliiglaciecola sp. CAU 1673]|uniref:hypothetical protein n=1 Tax=Aliiglaciecola sp. CAU 1673 TaxID=3032595 RepID=UPI0023DA74D1|nr:hypothetical protein [Aliiglaciecola sp. CAU 1673]MDF2180252.1 hypothetical protein [Aliiglaciecola sp. CAU 1673]
MKSKLHWLLVSAILFATPAWATKEVHQHASKDVGADVAVPKIALKVARDPIDGINMLVEIDNYVINSPLEPVEQSNMLFGHAHVFINGKKVQRLYGDALHIPASWLKPGVNQIAVSLNSHNHENWTVNGETIVSSVFIDPDSPELVLHHFTSQPLVAAHHH